MRATSGQSARRELANRDRSTTTQRYVTCRGRAAFRTARSAYDAPYAAGVDLVRPTADRFDETLALLRASDEAVLDVSDWTADELR